MMLRKIFATVLSVGFMALSAAAVDGPGITKVIYHPTAYTLPAGVWELEGTFSLLAFGLPWVGVAYGLTDNVQISSGLTSTLRGYPNLWIKTALGQMGPMALAVSGGFSYSIDEGELYLSSGMTASFHTDAFEIHVGTSFRLLPEFSLYPYVAFDYPVARNLFLLGEVEVIPFDACFGFLFRPLDALDLRLWMCLPGVSLRAGIALRF